MLLASEQIKRIYLEDLKDLPSDRMGLQLIQLIVIDEKKAISAAQNLLKRIKIQVNQKTAAYWLEWVETILVYKLPRLSREEIQHMLGYNDIELKQTRFYQDVFTEGRQEGEAKIILRQLNRRFGNLSPKTITKLHKLNSEQLEALADSLLDFTAQNELDTWLDKI